MPTTVILTSGTAWIVPSDWNSTSNTVEAVGQGGFGGDGTAGTAGQGRGGGGGGGGGAYAKISNFSTSAGASIAIAFGVDTQFQDGSTLLAKGGSNGSVSATGGAGGAGGAATSCVPTAGAKSGGNGNAGANRQITNGGGGGGAGGAGGLNNAGNDGVAGTAGGAGGSGGQGDGSSGGAGGAPSGNDGAAGTEWSSAGSGGGGSGGIAGQAPDTPNGGDAGKGGKYGGGGGGGGGGASGSGTAGLGLPGEGGVIVITYTPADGPGPGPGPGPSSSSSSDSENPCAGIHPERIGPCPDVLHPNISSLESSDVDCGPCYGERDNPRKHQLNFEDTDGFTLPGLVQFWWLNSRISIGRRHSCVTLHWDPVGKLREIELENYMADIARTTLWHRSYDWLNLPSSATEKSDGCPILPPGSTEESSLDKTDGVLARVYAIHGPPESSGSLSESSSSGACSGSVKVFYNGERFFECGSTQELSNEDSTLDNMTSEMGLLFRPNGLLAKVFFGGLNQCDDNPCVWDAENPPPGTSGVVLSLVTFVHDGFENNFRIYLVYFGPAGHYIRTCQYALLCGCEIGGERSDSTVGGTPCHDACLKVSSGCHPTPSESAGSIDFGCPATVSLGPPFPRFPATFCPVGTFPICNYIFAEDCCAFGNPEFIDSDITVPGEGSGTGLGCAYINGVGTCV